MTSDNVRWTTHPTADLDMAYHRAGLVAKNAWYEGEQYALFYAAQEKLKLVNRMRQEMVQWRTDTTAVEGADPQVAEVFKDLLEWLDMQATRLEGHHADTVGK